MKKFFSFSLCVCLLLTCLCRSPVSAVSVDDGDSALRNTFTAGSGGGLDYYSFSPVCRENTKYPLVIWLHGISSGNYAGQQLETYDFCKWASDEYQSRFADAGGAYLLCPRSAGGWDMCTTSTLKDCIASFVSAHADTIDTTRIYISGFSVGASMVIRMADAYPDYFAAAVPISAVAQPIGTVRGMQGTPVWFFANDKDSYISANSSATRTSFNTLADLADDKSTVRLTTVSQSVDQNGNGMSMQHYMWHTFTNDMFMADNSSYAHATTVDGTGAVITFTYPDGIIHWLSAQKNTKGDSGSTGKDSSSVLSSFRTKVINFFRTLLDIVLSLFH